MTESLSAGATIVLHYHQDHPQEFAHAGQLIGSYNDLQTLEDLDDIYRMLEERGYVEASASAVAGYQDGNQQKIRRTTFRYKST